MLSEFPQVKQEQGGGRRRWFQDGEMELILWFGATELPEGFQICYPGSGQKEHALTWRAGSGFNHAWVDTGDARPDKNMTPILVADGAVPWESLRQDFTTRSAGLEPALREFVITRLAEGGR